jgi:hypothetical protein
MAFAGDNTVRDPIPNGIFDQAYRIRGFVTVPDFSGWRPEDQIHIMALELGDPDAPISTLPGVYLKAGKIFGTHAATAGVEFVANRRYCVEVAIVINGIDGTVDQTLSLDGIEVGSALNADPSFLDPPSAALAGVSPSDNTSILVLIGEPVWNTQPIGCGESSDEAPGDPIYPGESGYPFLPSDPFYGEPYWPPDTIPIAVGEPGYPYTPEDPRYGDIYYPPPPEGTGSSGSLAVSVDVPADGITLSDDPLLIEMSTLELSSIGGVPVIEVWIDSHRVGEAFGVPPIFFWEWFGTSPGPHQIRAVAKSTSGARVYSSPITVYVPDITQPDISFISPPTGEDLSGIVDVAVSAEDDVEVAQVEIFVDNSRATRTGNRHVREHRRGDTHDRHGPACADRLGVPDEVGACSAGEVRDRLPERSLHRADVDGDARDAAVGVPAAHGGVPRGVGLHRRPDREHPFGPPVRHLGGCGWRRLSHDGDANERDRHSGTGPAAVVLLWSSHKAARLRGGVPDASSRYGRAAAAAGNRRLSQR